MNKKELINLFLRIGLAGVFIYATVSGTLHPDNWIGYIPQFLRNIFPAKYLLISFDVYELILSVWLLTGWKTFYSAVLSTLTLFGIIITSLGALDITFRDFGLLLAAIALAVDSKKK